MQEPYNTLEDMKRNHIPKKKNLIEFFSELPNSIHESFARLSGRLVANNIQSTMFASSHHGEGVTTIVLGIGATLATTHRVCIVDANLRKPYLHKIFKKTLAPGLCEYLKKQASFPSILQRTSEDRISLVCAGGEENGSNSSSTIPVNLARSKPAVRFFEELKKLFDFILIDAAPINLYAESALLSSYVDGVALVIASEQTNIDDVRFAKTAVGQYSGQVIGAILNKKKHYIPKLLDKWGIRDQEF